MAQLSLIFFEMGIQTRTEQARPGQAAQHSQVAPHHRTVWSETSDGHWSRAHTAYQQVPTACGCGLLAHYLLSKLKLL